VHRAQLVPKVLQARQVHREVSEQQELPGLRVRRGQLAQPERLEAQGLRERRGRKETQGHRGPPGQGD
jgi:hypothetical protein